MYGSNHNYFVWTIKLFVWLKKVCSISNTYYLCKHCISWFFDTKVTIKIHKVCTWAGTLSARLPCEHFNHWTKVLCACTSKEQNPSLTTHKVRSIQLFLLQCLINENDIYMIKHKSCLHVYLYVCALLLWSYLWADFKTKGIYRLPMT